MGNLFLSKVICSKRTCVTLSLAFSFNSAQISISPGECDILHELVTMMFVSDDTQQVTVGGKETHMYLTGNQPEGTTLKEASYFMCSYFVNLLCLCIIAIIRYSCFVWMICLSYSDSCIFVLLKQTFLFSPHLCLYSLTRDVSMKTCSKGTGSKWWLQLRYIVILRLSCKSTRNRNSFPPSRSKQTLSSCKSIQTFFFSRRVFS